MNTQVLSSETANKLAAYFQKQDEADALKAELLKDIVQKRSGKSNITTDRLEDCKKWYEFAKDNDDCFNRRYDIADYGLKVEIATVLSEIEKHDAQQAANTKVKHDIVFSDLRSYWSAAETVYDEESKDDKVLREKYKDLPKVGGERMTASEEDKTLARLEKKRNRRNGNGGATQG